MDNFSNKSSSNIVFFFSKSGGNIKILSNFAESPIKIAMEDISLQECPTGEHAFHLAKFITAAKCNNNNLTRRDELKAYAYEFTINGLIGHKNANDAKRAGGKKGIKLTDNEILAWNNEAENIQRHICECKYKNDKNVKDCLDNLDDNTILVHFNRFARENEIWGGRYDKSTNQLIGANKLGNIWMEIKKNAI